MNTEMIARLRFGIFILGMVLLTSCGGGGGNGGDDGDGTPIPSNQSPLADVGTLQQDVSHGFTVHLDGSASTDPEGDSLTYVWTQTHGPDVTGGKGTLDGATPYFAAPSKVCTIVFELGVCDSQNCDYDSVQVNVFENVSETLFVDGDNGNDDSGTGSRDNPYDTISAALDAIDVSPMDIYVMSRANSVAYDESSAPLSVPNGVSLYGGYDNEWCRDVTSNRTIVEGHSTAFMFENVDQAAFLSGFEITAADSATPVDSVYAVRTNGGTSVLYIEDNTIKAGDVAPGISDNPGSSYGISLIGLASAEVRRNDISTGRGGDGAAGANGKDGDNGDAGSEADSSEGASGGDGAGGRNGGRGGNGGNANDIIPPYDDGDKGEDGGGQF